VAILLSQEVLVAAASAAAGAAEEEGTRVERVAITRYGTDSAVEAVHMMLVIAVTIIQQHFTLHWKGFQMDIIRVMVLLSSALTPVGSLQQWVME
jgi:hypothetical protein